MSEVNGVRDMVKPMNDWVLVKRNPPQQRSSIIIAPQDSESPVRTGVVLRVGPGKVLESGAVSPMEVQEGDQVAFLRWHQDHRPGKATTKILAEYAALLGDADDVVMLRETDILFVYEGDVRVDLI